MPSDLDACVAAVGDKADNAWALCNWMKNEGKGYFAKAETNKERQRNINSAAKEFRELRLMADGEVNVMTVPVRKMSEGGNVLRGVEVFATGKPRDDGEVYTPHDLDEMVDNFRRYSTGKKPLLRVPAVLGHEEEQEFLDRSDIPAAAWAKRVYREGPLLKADFEDVPPQVADLIKAKRYRKVSAEIYPEPPEGVPGRGKMLRRVAFLGGEIPQVKSLDDIPMPEKNSERRGNYTSVLRYSETKRRPKAGTVYVFGELQPMNREEMLKQLAQTGFDCSVIDDDTPDEVIAECLRAMGSKADNQDELDEEAEGGGKPTPDTDVGGRAGGDRTPHGPAEDMADGKPTPDTDVGGHAGGDDTPHGPAEHLRPGENVGVGAQPGERHSLFDDQGYDEYGGLTYDDAALSYDDGLSYEENKERLQSFAAGLKRMMGRYATSCYQDVPGQQTMPPGSLGMGGGMMGEQNLPQHSPLPIAQRPMGTGQPPTQQPQGGPKKVTVTHQYRERQPIVGQFAELERQLFRRVDTAMEQLNKKLTEKVVKYEKFAEERIASEKRATIKARLQALQEQGKVLPAEMEAGLADVAYSLDATTVRTFSEGGKQVKMTPFDRFFKTLENRPAILRFAERFKDPMAGSGNQSADVARVEQAFDMHEQAFKKTGQTKEGLVKGFKAYCENHPDATAEKFLGPGIAS